MKWALRSIGSKQAVITNGVILHFGLLKKLSYKYIDGICCMCASRLQS